MLRLAGFRKGVVRGLDGFDSYAEWLDVPVDRRPPNHYELLGLRTGESDPARIRAASIERSARVRRYCLGPHGAEATRILGELGAAFACLSDSTTKAAYDRQLRRATARAAGVPSVSSQARAMPSRRRRPARKTKHAERPPVQQHVEAFDDEVPPRRGLTGEKKVPAAARSYSWLRRRREAVSSGPARFTVAATVLLAATCGAVWSTRRPVHDDVQEVANVSQAAQAAEPASTPITDKPSERPQEPAPMKKQADAARASPPSDVVNSGSTENGDVSRDDGGASTDRDEPTKNDVQPVRTPGDPNDVVDTAANAPPADSPVMPDVPTEPMPVPTKQNDPDDDSVSPFIERGDEQRSGKPTVAAGQVDRARVLLPGTIWRLRSNDDPEWLEVTLDDLVDATDIQLLEPSLPAMIDRALIEAADGSTAEITPRQVSPIFPAGTRMWSFGVEPRRTRRLWIHFRRTTNGVVELAGVEVFDHKRKLHFAPNRVLAVTKTPNSSGSPPETAAKPAATEKDGLAQVDEIMAQAGLEKAQRQPSVKAYATILEQYPRTAAAVEAVRGLADLHATMRRTGVATSAKRALERLVTRFPDTDAAKSVSQALKEADERE